MDSVTQMCQPTLPTLLFGNTDLSENQQIFLAVQDF